MAGGRRCRRRWSGRFTSWRASANHQQHSASSTPGSVSISGECAGSSSSIFGFGAPPSQAERAQPGQCTGAAQAFARPAGLRARRSVGGAAIPSARRCGRRSPGIPGAGGRRAHAPAAAGRHRAPGRHAETGQAGLAGAQQLARPRGCRSFSAIARNRRWYLPGCRGARAMADSGDWYQHATRCRAALAHRPRNWCNWARPGVPRSRSPSTRRWARRRRLRSRWWPPAGQTALLE